MLTTTPVAEEAGVSMASLYQYLPDRDAIIETLAETYLHRLENRMNGLLRSAGQRTWSDPVGILFDAFVDAYRSGDGFRALWFSRSLTDATQAADRGTQTADGRDAAPDPDAAGHPGFAAARRGGPVGASGGRHHAAGGFSLRIPTAMRR